jgi:hypothetical protein
MFLKFISAASGVTILISIHNTIVSRHALRARSGLTSSMTRLPLQLNLGFRTSRQ